MQWTEWETCGATNCLPSVLVPQSNTCSLDRMSAYYVDAQTPIDVQAALAFVKDHNIRLTIKNTGHDFLGRSSAASTLALRTTNMKHLQFQAYLEAYNCPAASQGHVGVMGAGVVAHEVVDYFLTHGMDITVGACPTVCIAGGLGQAGGHAVFGRSYGLMVGQAIEFDVVTADGRFRTINECNDPDLFWGMRGNGGGTYAILLSYKFKVYPKKSIAMCTFRANISSAAIPTSTRDTLTASPAIKPPGSTTEWRVTTSCIPIPSKATKCCPEMATWSRPEEVDRTMGIICQQLSRIRSDSKQLHAVRESICL